MKQLNYKGYTGSIEYSREDNLFFGKVIGIRSLISYEGKTGEELEKDFQEAVNSYLEDCVDNKREPEKPFKGSFNVRISPKLHYKAALLAQEEQMSLNSFVEESIRDKVAKNNNSNH